MDTASKKSYFVFRPLSNQSAEIGRAWPEVFSRICHQLDGHDGVVLENAYCSPSELRLVISGQNPRNVASYLFRLEKLAAKRVVQEGGQLPVWDDEYTVEYLGNNVSDLDQFEVLVFKNGRVPEVDTKTDDLHCY